MLAFWYNDGFGFILYMCMLHFTAVVVEAWAHYNGDASYFTRSPYIVSLSQWTGRVKMMWSVKLLVTIAVRQM